MTSLPSFGIPDDGTIHYTYIDMKIRITILLVILFQSFWSFESIARDPFNTTGFPACQGGEMGYWNIINRETPDRKVRISLVLTTIDIPDPAFIVCWVDGAERVMAMGPEKQL